MDAFEQLFIHLDLQLNNIRLVPLSLEHEQGLAEACRDGELWNLRITSTPHYTEVKNYIEKALIQKAQGSRYPFVVIERWIRKFEQHL
ncbi:hypothetical protein ACG9ZJ_17025 [Acinetobacter sp. ULE_I064]|uniref:hypothetical protein n=1 Tax=Acinetobacter sp. ULE_I064 TaxID=3373071 RepID=UPI003AF66C89